MDFAATIGHLRKLGFGFACASCIHMHRAYDNANGSVLRFTGCNKNCGGPFGGGFFPERQSPIPIDRICFVCGVDAESVVDVYGHFVGICEKHIGLLEKMSKPGVPPPFVTHKGLDVL